MILVNAPLEKERSVEHCGDQDSASVSVGWKGREIRKVHEHRQGNDDVEGAFEPLQSSDDGPLEFPTGQDPHHLACRLGWCPWVAVLHARQVEADASSDSGAGNVGLVAADLHLPDLRECEGLFNQPSGCRLGVAPSGVADMHPVPDLEHARSTARVQATSANKLIVMGEDQEGELASPVEPGLGLS